MIGKYTITEINQQFRIKVYGENNGIFYDCLVGISGLLNLISEEMAEKFIDRAFNSGLDKCDCLLRRGLKITFYSK